MTYNKDQERFLTKVTQGQECWTWNAAKGKDGRGYFYLNGKLWSAYTASYMLFNGLVKPGLLVSHKCFDKHCVNPNHLILSTKSEVTLRTYEQSRDGHKKHFKRKLSDDALRLLLEDDRDLETVASRFGVSVLYVYNLREGTQKSVVARLSRL